MIWTKRTERFGLNGRKGVGLSGASRGNGQSSVYKYNVEPNPNKSIDSLNMVISVYWKVWRQIQVG